MRRPRIACLSLLLLAVPMPGCGEAPKARLPARLSLLEGERPSPDLSAGPARYAYHPPQAAVLHARVTLPDGAVLLSGDQGERWRVEGARAEGASELAPESLLGIEVNAGGFVFVGRSGTTYHAETPLGPFVRGSAPPMPFARVRAGGGSLVGLQKGGHLHRSEDGGASWQRAGPEGVRFEDALIGKGGGGLALAAPEALWETRDGGATFRLLEVPPTGASGLFLDDARRIVVVGPLGARLWDPTGSPALVPVSGAFATGTYTLGVELAAGPSADALLEGRAVVVGTRFLEVRHDGSGYRLLRGTFGGRLEREPLPALRGCERAWLAAHGEVAYLACTRSKAPDTTQPVALFRSVDGARTWKDEPYVVEGRADELTLGVASDGELLLSGICSPETRGPGCRPAGVFRRAPGAADGGPSVVVQPAQVPSLTSVALALAVSPDGRAAYLLGKRTKGDALSAFVSHDGGRTFVGHEVGALRPLPTTTHRGRADGPARIAAVATERGAASFVIQRGSRTEVLVLDEAGRVLSVTEPPSEGARVGAAGERLFAFDPPSREAWESLDAGATWTSLGRLRADPCAPSGPCRVSVACVDAGCTLGDRVSRVGWREATRRTLLSPGGASRTDRREPKVGVPFVCSLDRTEWRSLPGAAAPPDAAAAALGKVAWFVVGTDPQTAAVTSLRMRAGGAEALEQVRLLEPSSRPEAVAFHASLQVEGVAAMRYALPTKEEPRLRNVELAWDDLLAGRVRRATVPDAGPYRPGDHETSKTGRAALANPALLSIASGGLYLRAHGTLGDAQPALFVDGSQVRQVPQISWPSSVARRGRAEMVRVGQSDLTLRLEGPTVVRGIQRGTSVEVSAVRLGFGEPAAYGVTQSVGLAYVGGVPGILVTLDPEGPEPATALLHPFSEKGPIFDPPVALPTQEDLAAGPRVCTAAERATTPRVVVPFQSGTRRPVIVADPLEAPREFLTDHAVLHGTPRAPCVAAYDAVSLRSSVAGRLEGSREVALVLGDAPERSFLFRTEPSQPGKAAAVEYRAMTCRSDAAAEIPLEVFREPGTHVSGD